MIKIQNFNHVNGKLDTCGRRFVVPMSRIPILLERSASDQARWHGVSSAQGQAGLAKPNKGYEQ
jgi:hypothetical protein